MAQAPYTQGYVCTFFKELAMRKVIAGLVVLAACGQATEPPSPGGKPHYDIVSGNAQAGLVGEQLAAPLVVQVTDDNGQPIAGQVVNFRVVQGGGSVFAGSAASNADGLVRELWTLGTHSADSQRVEARAVDSSTGEAVVFGIFTATASPGAPTQLAVIGEATQTRAVGTLSDSMRVAVQDRYGNPVDAIPVTWVLDTTTTATTTDLEGLAAYAFRLDTTPGTRTVLAQALDLPVRTFTVTMVPDAPARIAVEQGTGQQAEVGKTLLQAIGVRVVDRYNNGIGFVPVRFSTDQGSLSNTNMNTDASGRAAIAWTLGTRAGEQTVRIAVADTLRATVTAMALVGNTRMFTLDSVPTQAVGVPFILTLTAVDQYGNRTAYSGHPMLSLASMPGLLQVSTTPTSDFVNGQLQYTLTINTPGRYVVTLTDGLLKGITNTFDVGTP